MSVTVLCMHGKMEAWEGERGEIMVGIVFVERKICLQAGLCGMSKILKGQRSCCTRDFQEV